jgi:predicted nucleotidyltransferase
MIDLTPDQLAIIRDILSLHVPNAEIRVFGSRVSGKPKPWSDLDSFKLMIEDKSDPLILS